MVIYAVDGGVRGRALEVVYSGSFMGPVSVSARVVSPVAIDWCVGDYIIFRGERFTLRYIPAAVKSAHAGSYGRAFAYDDVVFQSAQDELTRCEFLDIVPEDNLQHYTALPQFSFYAADLPTLCGRMQANLDRLYGKGTWQVTYNHTNPPEFKAQEFAVSNEKCWEVLARFNTQLNINFTISGRTINLGGEGVIINHTFQYGKGKGLRSIEQTTNEQVEIATRLRAYGSTRNLPYRYYNQAGITSEARYVPNLMLPMFRSDEDVTTDGIREFGIRGRDAFVESVQGVKDYGVNEASVFFDGSDPNLDDIYPSIVGMTRAELVALGIAVNQEDDAIDKIASGSNIADSGILPEDGELQPANFTVVIPNIGFNIKDYLTTETARLAITVGACAGREFEIIDVEWLSEEKRYRLTLKRTVDSSIDVAYPNNAFEINKGDKYILVGITMPEIYILAAERRLLTAAKVYLLQNSYNKMIYAPKIDNIFLARHPEIANALMVGNKLVFMDTDLGVDAAVTISQLTVRWREGALMEYEVTLSEEQEAELVDRVSEAAAKIVVESLGSTNATANNIALIRRIGDANYVSKVKDDTVHGTLRFATGIQSTDYTSGIAGGGFALNNTTLEIDNIIVRKGLTAQELLLSRVRSINGALVVSAGHGKVAEVIMAGGQNAILRLEDAVTIAIGDVLRCQTFTGVAKNYFCVVEAVKGDRITVNSGSVALMAAGDELVQWGNVMDASRQSLIFITAATEGSPYIDLLSGLNRPDGAIPQGIKRTRLGNLDGIGKEGVSGHGLYSDNAFLGDYIRVGSLDVPNQNYVLDGAVPYHHAKGAPSVDVYRSLTVAKSHFAGRHITMSWEYEYSDYEYTIDALNRLSMTIGFHRDGVAESEYFLADIVFDGSSPASGSGKVAETFAMPADVSLEEDMTWFVSIFNMDADVVMRNFKLELGTEATAFNLSTDSIERRLTRIDPTGIYTGSITADQITAGTINSARINAEELNITKLHTIMDGGTIDIEGNSVAMFDSAGNLRMKIHGGELSAISSENFVKYFPAVAIGDMGSFAVPSSFAVSSLGGLRTGNTSNVLNVSNFRVTFRFSAEPVDRRIVIEYGIRVVLRSADGMSNIIIAESDMRLHGPDFGDIKEAVNVYPMPATLRANQDYQLIIEAYFQGGAVTIDSATVESADTIQVSIEHTDRLTEIASNGFRAAISATKYMLVDDNQILLRYGNHALRLTDQGIQRSSNAMGSFEEL